MKRQDTRAALLAVTFLATGFSYAQAQSRVVCGTDQYRQHSMQENPELIKLENRMNLQAGGSARSDDTALLVIPVVFHVIHDNGPENINKRIIEEQLATLNDAFRLRNKDTSLIASQFKDLAGDARIEFRLVTQDPWGRCTDGIDRIESSLTVNANDNVKSIPLAWWDSRQYLNIWVVRSLQQTNPMGLLAGYAQFPWIAVERPYSDGIVIGYQFIGKGRKTLTHEVGHYLGLYHTFQDGCGADPALEGDHVKDTPPAAEANFGCDKSTNSCHVENPDLPDMIDNYMDYSDCTHMFTKQQCTRMRWFLQGDAREQIISQENYDYVFASCATSTAEGKTHSTQMSAYPNPSSGDITITVSNLNDEPATVKIFDVAGRLLNTSETRLSGGQVQLKRDQIGKAQGIYQVQITSGELTGFVKVMLID